MRRLENVNASETRKIHMNILPQLMLNGEEPPPHIFEGAVAA
jgi:hypothetical protein